MRQGMFFRHLRNVALITVVTALALVFAFSTYMAPKAKAASLVGPKANYLALGDSLAFGFQPDGDFNHGYADFFFRDLRGHGTARLTNLACSGETTRTMINGGCIDKIQNKVVYPGSQLRAAVNFLRANAANVSPVTLNIGADNFLLNNDIDTTNCTVSSRFNSDLATMDADLTNTILPQLSAAMTVNGRMTGDLVVLTYYDPFQNICPNLISNTLLVNQHIVNDVSGFNVTTVDIFSAFGGPTVPNPNICNYTWMCTNAPTVLAIHATDTGYQVMANAVEQTVGY